MLMLEVLDEMKMKAKEIIKCHADLEQVEQTIRLVNIREPPCVILFYFKSHSVGSLDL